MPLTSKGETVLRAMQAEYGRKKGKEVFNASRNAKTITGVDAEDMSGSEWDELQRLFGEWIAEERKEPEHADDEAFMLRLGRGLRKLLGFDAAPETKKAASILFVAPSGKVLLLKRSPTDDYRAGEWGLPGGKAETGEEAEDAARREAKEEVGDHVPSRLDELLKQKTPKQWDHVTYLARVPEEFEPTLSEEHTAHVWAMPGELPEPRHSAIDDLCRKMKERLAADANSEGKLSATTREDIGREGSERREEMPQSAFLGPDRTYPVKEKRDGEWKYTRNLLLAAARRARMQGRKDIARRADAIREREFSDAEDCFTAKDDESFEKLEHSLAHKKGVHDPKALAVFIGREHGKIPGRDEALVAMAADRMPGRINLFEDRRQLSGVAFDRKSTRTIDHDGRLRVSVANISKSNVSPYWGHEIPDWDRLGLEPNKIYRLYRDPKELAKAVDTFNGVPILDEHQPSTAEDHPRELVVGATGTEAKFEAPYLKNSLIFWPQEAINDIDRNERRQLSASYRYVADMTPGVTPEGEQFDGRMTQIFGNHVMLCAEGRVGSDVMVGDAALKKSVMRKDFRWADLPAMAR